MSKKKKAGPAKKVNPKDDYPDGVMAPMHSSEAPVKLSHCDYPITNVMVDSAEALVELADSQLKILGDSEMYGYTIGLMPGYDNVAPSRVFGPVALMTYFNVNLKPRIDMATIQQNCPDAKGKSVDRILQGWYGEDLFFGVENCAKILRANPTTKRAVITLGRRFLEADRDASEWKCMRELVFTLRDGKLNCHAFARAQALEVLPKNLFVNTSIQRVLAEKIGAEPGWYLHTMALLFRGGQDKT